MSRRVTRIWVVLGVALTAASAAGIDFEWIHPCPCGDRDGGNPAWNCPAGCHCEADWNDTTVWTQPQCTPPPPPPVQCGVSFPKYTGDSATITHSNHGCCATGDCDCSSGGECIRGCSGSCDDLEGYLEIDLATVTIGDLTIETDNVVFNDCLTVRFTGGTLTVDTVTLDATNGPLKVLVLGTAVVQTN